MKRAMVIFPILFLMAATAGWGAKGELGAGIILGSTTGLSGKFWMADKSALDAAAGWNFENRWFAFQAGYLYHFPVGDSAGPLAAYAGAGGLFEYKPPPDDYSPSQKHLSARVPLGLEYRYKPIGFFAEIQPIFLFLFERFTFDFGGGLGARFYF